MGATLLRRHPSPGGRPTKKEAPDIGASLFSLVGGLVAAAAAATASASTAAAAAGATAAAATSAGEHGVVDHEANLATQVLDVVDGRLFQEGRAVRVHEEFDSLFGQDGVIGLTLVFHGQHILKATGFGGHSNYPQRPISFTLFLHDFLELFDSESSNFHSLALLLGAFSGRFSHMPFNC